MISGKRYLDGMASLWYMNVGHGHPAMIEAISNQAKELAAYHAFPPFTNPPADRAADTIAGLAPMEGCRVFFADSGSEAVDSAMKLARIAHREAGDPTARSSSAVSTATTARTTAVPAPRVFPSTARALGPSSAT